MNNGQQNKDQRVVNQTVGILIASEKDGGFLLTALIPTISGGAASMMRRPKRISRARPLEMSGGGCRHRNRRASNQLTQPRSTSVRHGPTANCPRRPIVHRQVKQGTLTNTQRLRRGWVARRSGARAGMRSITKHPTSDNFARQRG
jgi:hypothetical protein